MKGIKNLNIIPAESNFVEGKRRERTRAANLQNW